MALPVRGVGLSTSPSHVKHTRRNEERECSLVHPFRPSTHLPGPRVAVAGPVTINVISPTPRAFTFPMNVHTPSRSPSNSPFDPGMRMLTFSTPPPLHKTQTRTLSGMHLSLSIPLFSLLLIFFQGSMPRTQRHKDRALLRMSSHENSPTSQPTMIDEAYIRACNVPLSVNPL